MKFTLYNIGKTNISYIEKGIDDYTQRISHYVNFSINNIPDIKNTGKLSPQLIQRKEGELLKKVLSDADYIILLDEKGKEFTSRGLSEWLNRLMNMGHRKIAFVTGGAYGFSDEIYKVAQAKIALSRLTFTHQMVRLIFTEQFYRAFTILKGMKYHND